MHEADVRWQQRTNLRKTAMRTNKLKAIQDPWLSGFDRTASEQAHESLRQALRALDLVPNAPTALIPHPVTVVRAEIENARRYLGLVGPSSGQSSDVAA